MVYTTFGRIYAKHRPRYNTSGAFCLPSLLPSRLPFNHTKYDGMPCLTASSISYRFVSYGDSELTRLAASFLGSRSFSSAAIYTLNSVLPSSLTSMILAEFPHR
jgi:hypothetical protein